MTADRYDDAEALLEQDYTWERRARRLLLCAQGLRAGDVPPWQLGRVCHLRCCRACADRHARELRARVLESARRFESPTALLATRPSGGLWDLRPSFDSMLDAVRRLRYRRSFTRACRAGVLVFETPLTADGRRWAVHAHGVLDVAASEAWEAETAERWRELVGIPGAVFSLEPLRDLRAFAGYAAKVGRSKSWSGAELEPGLRARLDRALRGRRLVARWG